jgi:transcriptional repressor NrdR
MVEKEGRALRCPYCGHLESKVLDSRAAGDGDAIRRRRECLSCARRFTTYERLEETVLLVVKKDGRREPFERGKILAGLRKACEKRPIPAATLEDVVGRIERDLRNGADHEIPSAAIGERIMRELRGIDEVAYVRFASVYREFKDLDTFREELARLKP